MFDLNALVQAFLFALFANMTAALSAVIGPTYDGLVVPQLDASSLYPALAPGSNAGGGFLATAAGFSNYLVVNVVDPTVALVILLVGVSYLLRGSLGRYSPKLDGLLPRVLIAVVVANFTVPIANALVAVGGATFPVVGQFDGGAWQQWVNLAGVGEVQFSWDNGAVAFVFSFVLFTEVFLLALALAFRDAALAVLLVLLPIFTLLWPIPSLSGLARRGWKLFGELVFLPCVILVPLELAVGSANVLVLVSFLGLALAAPVLISTAGTQLGQLGFPAATAALAGGLQRGLGALPAAGTSPARGALSSASGGSPAASGFAALIRTAGTSSFPATAPLIAGEFLGRGAFHLVRHLRGVTGGEGSAVKVPPVRPKGGL